MPRPLVSVVTPTWQRPDLLAETICHVREQDYRPVEHVIVSDGRDDDVAEIVAAECTTGERYISAETGGAFSYDAWAIDLGRNWSGLMPESFGIAPLLTGYLLARGEYLMPWCDDERALTPDHISLLVDLLESTGADFVYPKVRIWRNGDPDGPETAVIGTDPPRRNQITHYLFRAACLWRFGMPRWSSHPVDWSLVDDWMKAGAKWAMLPEVTFSHRLDR